MKKIFIFTLLSCITISLLAQITIKDEIVERPVYKPQPFDSLTNFTAQENFFNYKKYIGYELYCLPFSTKYKFKKESDKNYSRIYNSTFTVKDSSLIIEPHKPFYEEDPLAKMYFPDTTRLNKQQQASYQNLKEKYEKKFVRKTNICYPYFFPNEPKYLDGTPFYTNPDSLSGHYFTILDFEFFKYNKYYSFENFDPGYDKFFKFRVKLKNNLTGDTLYWNTSSYHDDPAMVLVPYLVKQQQFKSKKFVTQRTFTEKVDTHTGEIYTIKPFETWECVDVAFVNTSKDYFVHLYYFLRNGDKEITFESREINDEQCFITEEKYLFLEAEKQRKKEEIERERVERERMAKEEKIKHEKAIIEKYGSKIGTYINNNQVVIGMTAKMCEESWGRPINVYTTYLQNQIYEQWVYDMGTYLYFKNGILTAIQK